MADQIEAKTKTIGYLPIEKVQTLKGWHEYVDKSSKLSVLRTEAQKAKNSVRDALKERLNEHGDIDFVGEGDRIRVFRVFRKQQPARRTRTPDLSSSFREQPLEGTAETNGQSEGGCVGDETEDSPADLSPTTEEAAASLDPVTERLMTIMREKAQR
ncbi:MAG TPA: hypothetical protein VKB89_07235 [Xanthobacteraceae bacterium]|nr:hypothetical protein [Xanthobacteraceae bacterium]